MDLLHSETQGSAPSGQPTIGFSHYTVRRCSAVSHERLCEHCVAAGSVQVKYVVELARALAQHPAVFRVDLLTRLIQDPSVDPSYGEPEESIWKAPDDPGMGGAYIVRLPCGPPKTYLRYCTSLSVWDYSPKIRARDGEVIGKQGGNTRTDCCNWSQGSHSVIPTN